MLVLRQALGHVAHHVLHEGGLGEGVLGDVFLVLALEQGVDGGRARSLGHLDEFLDPAETRHAHGQMDHGALAVRALAADGLGAGTHGHHGHVHFQQEGLALLVQLAGQTAFIRDDALDARRGRGLVHEIGEAEAHIGTARFQAFLDRGQQAAHRLVVDFVVPFFQRFDEAAHVRALERGGQIHTKVHPGHGLAAALGAVAHQQGHGDAADADAVDIDGNLGGMALHVFHYARSCPVVVPLKVPCLTPLQEMSLSASARTRAASPLRMSTSRQL